MKYLKILFFFLIPAVLQPVYSQENDNIQKKEVRIGIFPFEPVNYIDNSGFPSGLNPTLIKEISKSANWKVRYVEGSWSEGLNRLQRNEIDLLMSVAWSLDRSEFMDYTIESVMELWGQVYTSPESSIRNINDLDGKKVGIMKQDITGRNLIETAQSLNIFFEITEYPGHHDLMKAIEKGDVHAGAAPQHFGLRQLSNYNLVSTSILFSPYSIYFASRKGQNGDLLEEIDKHMSQWKKDKDSVYYETVRYWLAPDDFKREVIPSWTLLLLWITAAVVLCFAGLNFFLRGQIQKRTAIIREHESRYRSLFQQLESLIIRLDAEGTVLMINDYALSLLDKERDEILDKNVMTLGLLPDGLSLESMRHPEELKQTDMIQKVNTPSDIYIYIQWSLSTGSDGRGSLNEIICLGVNISERVKMEQALRESENRFTSFMNNFPAYAFIKNDRGEHIYSNPATIALLENPPETPCADDFFEDSKTTAIIREVENRILTGEKEYESFEYETLFRGNKQLTRLQEIRFPIQLDNGKKALGGIAFDVTESRAIEEQLNQSRKMQAIGELAGGIAHDFNNQLSGIMGYADLLTRGISDPRQEKYAAKLLAAVERASEVTRQLLSFSRKGKKEIRSININDLIRELMTLLSHSIEKKVSLHFELMEEKAVIKGDPNLIQNALLNLALNGRDAMDACGSLYFSTQKIYVDDKMAALQGYALEKGPYLKVSVEDSGKGMPREVMEKIFEPFFTTKAEGKGTGMGLAMVYGAMKEHQGNVTVQSTPGKGTVFSLYFPFSGRDQSAEKEAPVISDSPMVSYRIAIVDDEQMIRDFLSLSLKDAGHRVTSFEGGREAVNSFRENQFSYDMVILDMMMPGMGGLETYRRLSEIHRDIPVLLSSGYSPKNDLQEIMKNPYVSYLQKPYSLAELHSAIEALMQSAGYGDAP